jgi:flagellar hook-associated protein 2
VTDTAFELHRGTATVQVQHPADGSLQSLVSAINSTQGAGVRAAAVQVSTGQYRLQLTATDTGSANAFTLTGAGGAPLTGMSFTQVSSAHDAVLHVGDVGSGFDITSGSNTIEGVMPGVTVKATALASSVTVGVSQDQSAITAAVQSLVDAANSALVTIGSVGSNGVVGTNGKRTGAGALAGDGLMRQLTSQILSKVTAGVGGKSLSSVGIGVNKDGIVTFDSTKFGTAVAADPTAVQSMFSTAATGGTGFADSVAAFAAGASSSTGTISSAVSGRQSTITDLTDRISGWDVRLANKQASLQKQYAALEVALGKLKNQSTWLAGQVSSLSNNSKG